MKPSQYAKAIIAVLGAGITAALGIVPADGDLFAVLTIAAAVVTAAAVFFVPNGERPPVADDPTLDVDDTDYDDGFEPKHRAE